MPQSGKRRRPGPFIFNHKFFEPLKSTKNLRSVVKRLFRYTEAGPRKSDPPPFCDQFSRVRCPIMVHMTRREGCKVTTVYVDSVFVLNTLMDYLLLLCTARLAGIPLRRWRYALGALLAGPTPWRCFCRGGAFWVCCR